MRKSIHRLTALALTVALIVLETAVPVYAVEDNAVSAEEVNVSESEPSADPETDEEKPDINKTEEITEAGPEEQDDEFEAIDNSEDKAVPEEEPVPESDDPDEDDEMYVPEGVEFASGYVAAPGEDEYESAFEDGGDSFLESLPAKYVSSAAINKPSRNQNPFGTCWAFASVAAAELSASKRGVKMPDNSTAGLSTDLSELHLAYFAGSNTEPYDPLGGLDGDRNARVVSINGQLYTDYLRGGSVDNAAHLFSSWIGVADESNYTYSNTSSQYNTLPSFSTDRTNAMDDVLHLRGFYIANPITDRDGVKNLVREYGAATISYYDLDEGGEDAPDLVQEQVYSSANNCYYMPLDEDSNHAVTIIGWDDDFSRDNFAYSDKPEGDGAWLIRNSWVAGNKVTDSSGTLSGNSARYYSYFWLSYYDKSISESCHAFDMGPLSEYDHNYQYDGCMTNNYIWGPTQYANIYTAGSDSEVLKAVYFSTHSANIGYTIDVYTGVSAENPRSGTRVINSQSGSTTYAGGYTVELNGPVNLEKGQKFSVIISVPSATKFDCEASSSGGYTTNANTVPGRSLYYNGGWADSTTVDNHLGDFRIKAFTCDDDSAKVTVTLDANGGTFGADDTTKTISVRENGTYGSLPTPERPGYTFAGWYTSATGGDQVSASTGVIDTSEHTLYAHWTGDEITVSYNANKGSCSTDKDTVTVGEPYGQLPTPSRTGYTFAGWYTQKEGGDKVTADTTVTATDFHYLYAHWTANTYTVTFDLRLDGATCSPLSKTVTYDSTYGDLPVPVKSGYTFSGWYKHPTSTSQKAVGSETKVETAADHTLYAHWDAKKVVVTYDPNGGSCTVASREFTVGEEYLLLPDKSATKRKGYDFVGWFTAASGGDKVTTETVVTNPEAHTLYAHWELKTLTVTFDANGSGATCSPASGTVTYSGDYAGLLNTATATRPGYSFAGWFDKATGGNEVKASTTVTKDADHKLYAHWTANEYTITFDVNLDGATCSETTREITFNKQYGTLPTPTRAGYTFNGWFPQKTGGEQVTSTQYYRTVGNQTLYAQWNVNSYRVTFNKNASDATCNPSYKTVIYNTAYGDLPVPTRPGYEFAGWYTLADGGTLVRAETKMTTAKIHSLYAHWTMISRTVTFNENYEGGSVTTRSVQDSKKVGVLPVPERELYSFDGWYTLPEGGSRITTQTVVSGDVTYYAHWTLLPTYTIVFNDNYAGGGSTSKEYLHNTVLGELPVPERVGYSFAGWFPAGKNAVAATSQTPVTEDITYYARWTVGKYTLTYDANGAGAVCRTASKQVVFDAKYGTLPTATRPGYTFAGWFDEAEGGTLITAASYVRKGSDHSIYAHWNPNRYLLVLDPQGGVCTAESVTVTFADAYGELPSPSKMGYAFAGWYTLPSGGVMTESTTVVATAAKHTVYAHWTPDTYTVTFDLCDDGSNAASLSDGASATRNVVYASAYGDLPSAAWPGHAFLGWYTAPELGEDDRDKGLRVTDTTSVTTADAHTLYARWEDWGEVRDEEDQRDRDGFTGPQDIAGDNIWVRGIPERVTYRGEAYRFDDLRVYRSNKLLTAGQDYSITYKNNVNAGTASVIITGKGNYNGKRTETFAIDPIDLEAAAASGRAYASNVALKAIKKVQKAATTVYYTFDNGKTVVLKNKKDYYYPATAYAEVLAAPSGDDGYEVTIEGKGNYKGTLTFKEIILPANDASQISIAKVAVKAIPTLPASGKPIEFEDSEEHEYADLLELSTGKGATKHVLERDTEYEIVGYKNNVLPGTATVIINGKSPYFGTRAVSFKISAKPVNKAVATLSGDVDTATNSAVYTGAPIIPDVSLSYSPKKGVPAEPLTAWDHDASAGSYEITGYANNINAGKNKATVYYAGKGDFTGTGKKTFTIKAASLSADNEGEEIGNVTVNVMDPDDHEVLNTNKIEANGKEYDCVPFRKGGAKLDLRVIFYGKDNNGAKKEYTLAEGRDYTLTYRNNSVVNMTLDAPRKMPYVTIKGKGNFTGSRIIYFAIQKSDLNRTTMTATDVVYKKKVGNFVTKIALTDTDGKALSAGKDYGKYAEYYYDSIPDGTHVLDKNGNVINVEIGSMADAKNHIVPAGTTMKVRVLGTEKGPYDRFKEGYYRVTQGTVASATVKIVNKVYTGRQINISYDDIISAKVGKVYLTPGDYIIENSYVNQKAGKGTIIIKGRGNYGGTKAVTFRILNRSMK